MTRPKWLTELCVDFEINVMRRGYALTAWDIVSAPLRFTLYYTGSGLVWLAKALNNSH